MKHPGTISNGYTPVLDVHTSHIATKFEKILDKIDRRTNKVLEADPQGLKTGDCGNVKLIPTK
jgi:elongation factor 1-alpha